MTGTPNFLIIGAQKSGSTWIYDSLKKHPEIHLPDKVELCHFNRLDCEEPKPLEQYLSNFDNIDQQIVKCVGEKSPSYFWTSNKSRSNTQPPKSHNPSIPQSVSRVLGKNISIIVSLRHPISRAISAYRHHGIRKRIKKDEYLIEASSRFGIKDIGFYDQHLLAWEKEFEKRSICSLIFESDIKENSFRGYDLLCDFLSISKKFVPEDLTTPSNANVPVSDLGNRIETGVANLNAIRPQDVRYLIDEYKDEMNRLYARFGSRLDCWRQEDMRYEEFSQKLSPPRKKKAPKNESTPLKKLENPSDARLDMTPDTVGVQSPMYALFASRLGRWKRDNIGFVRVSQKVSALRKKSRQKNRSTPQLKLENPSDAGLDMALNRLGLLGPQFTFEAPVRTFNSAFHGSCQVGAFSYLVDGHVYRTKIGRYCSIAAGVNIGQGDHPKSWLSTSPFQFHPSFRIKTGEGYPWKTEYDSDKADNELIKKAHKETGKYTSIGNDVWLGNSVIVISGVKIGTGAIIGAGAVVTRDVNPYEIVGGVPAKKIGSRFDTHTIERLLKSRWWEFAPWQLRHLDFSNINSTLINIEKMRNEGQKTYEPGFQKMPKSD